MIRQLWWLKSILLILYAAIKIGLWLRSIMNNEQSQIIFMIYGVRTIELISSIDLSVFYLFYHYFGLNQPMKTILKRIVPRPVDLISQVKYILRFKGYLNTLLNILLPPIHPYFFPYIESAFYSFYRLNTKNFYYRIHTFNNRLA